MYTLLMVLILIVCLLLAGAVLLQAGQGGGLASLGGGAGDNIVGGRQAETILTKGTWSLGGAFMVLALILSVMSAQRGPVSSRTQELLQQQQPQQAPASNPLPLGGSAPTTAPAGTAPATTAPAGGTPAAPAPTTPKP
ncbi:MAG: preprotein translocase subunit SecG [Gemmatimonadetes bacterium]|nr:preprotein translocase subunit SecG [Gemmatimonadota bacterium]